MVRKIGIQIGVGERDRIPEPVADADARGGRAAIEMTHEITVVDNTVLFAVQTGQIELQRAARVGQDRL